MSDPKRHHYIPLFLCNNFTDEDENLFRYDVELDKCIPTNAKDGFVEKDLYTLEKNGVKDRLTVESKILDRSIESPAANTIDKLIKNSLDGKPEKIMSYKKHRRILTNFIAISHLRTPKYIHQQRVTSLRRRILYSVQNKDQSPESIEPPTFQEALIMTLSNYPEISSIIYQMNYQIIINKSEVPFLLPDQPISLDYSNRGEFHAPDLEIYVPLSKNVLLKLSRRISENDVFEISDGVEIGQINSKICSRYYRFIASSDADYLVEFIKYNAPTAQSIEDFDVTKEDSIRFRKELLKLIEENKGRHIDIKLTKDGYEVIDG